MLSDVPHSRMFQGILVGLVSLVAGILIGLGSAGYFDKEEVDSLIDDRFLAQKDLLSSDIIQKISGKRIEGFSRTLTSAPHLAALKRDKELVDWIEKSWKGFGLDRVERFNYDVLLSYPNRSHPNKIRLLDQDGEAVFESQHKETPLRREDEHPDFIHAFNAYAPAGDVKGDLIYVNYGRVEDLQYLEGLGISVQGKICISRYGKIFRGNRLKNCEKKGCIGVIMFSDPAEVAILGTEPENVYPNTFFLPGSGIQRGTTLLENGDPLSPGWPSVAHSYRLNSSDILAKIPSQPIGYDDAKRLLEIMGGRDPPEDWKGKIPGIEYKIGDMKKKGYENYKVRLTVNNFLRTVPDTTLIGYIVGEIEPDRYVFLSNHRDAWGYGSADPSSGTAQLMEVARVLGEYKLSGRRPRRTIVFGSWGSEEYGLIGSNEFVSHKFHEIQQRTVGLVNTDVCVSGPIADPQASPGIQWIVHEALRAVSDPMGKENNYYDFWTKWWNLNKTEHTTPEVRLLGSGSDHAPFAFQVGVPAIDLKFKDDKKKYIGLGQYPTYHTGYETFFLMNKMVDPGFKIHKTCAQASTYLLMKLADSSVIPYDLLEIPKAMTDGLDKIVNLSVTKSIVIPSGVTFAYLRAAIKDFKNKCNDFMNSIGSRSQQPYQLRALNDQLMMFQKVFIKDKHTIFAPSTFNSYGSSVFPGLSDLLHEIDQLSGQELDDRIEKIKKQVSDLMIYVQMATSYLGPVEYLT